MVAKLSDKQPITFEWLNSLVDAINDLKGDITDVSESIRPIVFAGDAIASNNNSKVKVVADQHQIASAGGANGKDNIVTTVTFPSNFKDNSVVVVATADFLTSDKVPYRASVSVGSVTDKQFSCRVSIVDDKINFNKKTAAIVINYIAIGNAP